MSSQVTTEEKVDRVWGAYPERKGQMVQICKRIKPAMRFSLGLKWNPFRLARDDGGALYYLQSVDPFGIPYTWNPKPAWRTERLVRLCDIDTYHVGNHHTLFSPSIAEVIAQIPAQHFEVTVVFEIIVFPGSSEDFNAQWEIAKEGYHLATTRLYARA